MLWKHSAEGVPAAPPQHLPHREPCLALHGFDELPESKGPRQLGSGITLLVHHPAPRPPRGPELSVMTYNILLGGLRRERLVRYFAELEENGWMPDVIGLQEASQPMAIELAHRHGFHLIYFGRDAGPRGPVVNGKAWLSRYPVRETVHFTYALPEPERQAAIHRQGHVGELDEDRGTLYVLLEVAGRSLALHNVHHTLGDSGLNAGQLWQLHTLVHERNGVPTIVLGDFNANVNVKHRHSWMPRPIRKHEPTETVRDYESRYGDVHPSVGDWGVGNIADARVRHALHALEEALPDVFQHAREVRVRLPDGSYMDPEAARERLVSGEVPRDSEAWLRLQDVADLATLNSLPDERGVVPATGKRFDTFFASRELETALLEVDHATEASDHLPVLARFRLRHPSP